MKTLWDRPTYDEVVQRIGRLTAGSRPRWGRMSCPQMVVHVTDALGLYTGELSAPVKRTPLQYAPFKQVLVYVLPMPRNVPTAPELLARVPDDWDDEIARLHQALAAFAAQHARSDWPLHPLFGRLSCRAYGVLAYKHTDHHLRQFGV